MKIQKTALTIMAIALSAGPGWVSGDDQPTASVTRPAPEIQGNLLKQMVIEGIELTPDKRFVLPVPDLVCVDGTLKPAEDAARAFDKIAGRHGDRFIKDSVVAPISVQTDSITNANGDRIGHFIDVAFAVHQTIDQIRNSEVIADFKKRDAPPKTIEFSEKEDADDFEKSQTRALTKDELAAFGISANDDSETLGHLQLPILSQVVVRGVARTQRSVWSDEDVDAPIILTWILDSRFGSDSPAEESLLKPTIANQWQPIQRSDTGEKSLGPPRPYAGLGGYVAITPVPGTPEASLVQIRFVLHEPQDWFSGRNLLRSKLPILIQDRVRGLRRELK